MALMHFEAQGHGAESGGRSEDGGGEQNGVNGAVQTENIELHDTLL
jgi:hypothetical protein